jgi:thiosulfate dehydrogenase
LGAWPHPHPPGDPSAATNPVLRAASISAARPFWTLKRPILKNTEKIAAIDTRRTGVVTGGSSEVVGINNSAGHRRFKIISFIDFIPSRFCWTISCSINRGQLSTPDQKGYKMKLVIRHGRKTMGIAAALLLSSGLTVLGIQQAAATEPQLENAIQDGKALFVHETFGGNGRNCQSCHVDGGVGPGKLPNGTAIPSLSNAATIYPRFNSKANKVITLEDQLRTCIAGGLQGKPPTYGSEQLTQLVTYVTSLAQDKPVDMGGKPQ